MALRRAMSCATFVAAFGLALAGAPAATAHNGEHGAPVRPPGGTYRGPIGAAHNHGSAAQSHGAATSGHDHGAATTGSGPDQRTRLAVVLGFVALNLSIIAIVAFVQAYRPRRVAAAR